MKRKSIIIIFIGLIVLLIIGGVSFVLLSKKSKKEENNNNLTELEITIINTIKSINEINPVFQKENLEETEDFKMDGDFTCYKYIGDNSKEYIEKIRELYIEAYNNYSNFKTKEGNLYVCFSPKCEVEDIKNYKIIEDSEQTKSVQFDDKSIYMMSKYDDEWKFAFPIINCKE